MGSYCCYPRCYPPAGEQEVTGRGWQEADEAVQRRGLGVPGPRRGGWVGLLTVDGRRRKVRAATKVDVLAKLNRMRADADRGIVRPDGNATVQPLLDQWARRVMPNRELAPKSRENYELALRVLGAEFGRDRVAKLNTACVERGSSTSRPACTAAASPWGGDR